MTSSEHSQSKPKWAPMDMIERKLQMDFYLILPFSNDKTGNVYFKKTNCQSLTLCRSN